MASLTQWTWVWVNSRSWWWTGRPSVLQFMESQRVGHDWATELNWTDIVFFFKFLFFTFTLQYCIGFAIHQHESTTGIHVFAILNPLPPLSLYHLSGHPSAPAPSIQYRTWTGNSFHTLYFTCFNAILPNLPTLSLSHRVHKTVLYISVSFAVLYTGLLLPSF